MSGIDTIAVFGLGNVGLLAARLLHEAGFTVEGHDLQEPAGSNPFATHTTDVTAPDQVDAALTPVDPVL